VALAAERSPLSPFAPVQIKSKPFGTEQEAIESHVKEDEAWERFLCYLRLLLFKARSFRKEQEATEATENHIKENEAWERFLCCLSFLLFKSMPFIKMEQEATEATENHIKPNEGMGRLLCYLRLLLFKARSFRIEQEEMEKISNRTSGCQS
jgi:hypothetical protein